jgi:L-ascorbate metabolism protein UlaG (beta-lactamase superfamily)
MSDRGFPKHFDGRRFYNQGAPQARGFLDVLRWKLRSRPEPSPAFISDVQQSTPPRCAEGGELRITLVNHSTVLIQQRNSNILTDPIWSERASPVSWLGPRRRRKPGVRIDDLPEIDVVLISHNHYDHLDLWTLRQIAARGRSTFVVAASGARLLRSARIEPVYELDWGESLTLSGFNVHCVPALHFSARGILDRNKTLWCGYVIDFPERLVYFAGDTAFGSHLRRFGKSSALHTLHYCPSGHMSHAGLCHQCTWLPKRRLEPTQFSVPKPASRSTTELSSWRMKASTLHRNSLWLVGETIRF